MKSFGVRKAALECFELIDFRFQARFFLGHGFRFSVVLPELWLLRQVIDFC
jgi:hypothetical protein